MEVKGRIATCNDLCAEVASYHRNCYMRFVRGRDLTWLVGTSGWHPDDENSSTVANRPYDASCLSVVSFNSTKRRVESFIVSYVGYRVITACS